MRGLGIGEFLLGLLIVIAVLYDLFQTVVLPRPTPSTFRPSGKLVGALYTICRRLALLSPKYREQLLGTFAPFMVVVLLLYWAAGLVLGYGLVLYSLTGELQPLLHPGTAIYFSAMALLSFGFGDVIPTGGIARLVVILESATGLGMVALVITFLFTLFGEFERREILVITLSYRAGAPPSGIELLQTYARDDMLGQLDGLFADWEVWSAQVLESHLSYPMLNFFRSTHDHQSWVSALGAVLDAGLLILTTVETVPRGAARLMLRGGVHLVEDLAQYYHLDVQPEPYVERAEFDGACKELRAAGFQIGDDEAAWEAFSRARSEYAGPLNEMAKQWVTPPTQWIGDRSVRIRHVGRVVRR